jgi:hypothetical protein
VTERKQAEATLQNLAAITATGASFFLELVGRIAEALNVPYVMVSEKVEDTLHTLAFWADGLQPNFTYTYAQTPCELHPARRSAFTVKISYSNAFQRMLALVEMEAVSYLGIALHNAQGQTIGELCLLDKAPLQQS